MAIDTTIKENRERAEQEGEALTDKVILVVDDSPTVCKIVKVTLTKMGCRVVIAEDGLEALAKIATGYITKPFQPYVLTETVEKHLTDRR